jgi:GrpB-like predicted nucleotidyltransferase (UPF0157 family)
VTPDSGSPRAPGSALVEPYNPAWATWFLELNALLGRTLAGHFYAIEHIGSTSVPGMVAKPIIDIDVVMREGQFERIASYLAPLGYEHVGDQDVPGREAFKLRGPLASTLPLHHLYALYPDAAELKRHLAFRDYLRTHPEEARRLSEHKLELAERFDNDRALYIEGKAAMVLEMIEAALAEQKAPA